MRPARPAKMAWIAPQALCGSTSACILCEPNSQWWEVVRQRSRPRIFSAGACLLREGYSADSVSVICSGIVLLKSTASDGKILIEGSLGQGQWLGITSVLTGQPCGSTAEVRNESLVRSIDPEWFRELLRQFPSFTEQLVILAHSEIARISARSREAVFCSSRQRLARILLAISQDEQAHESLIRVSLQDLSGRLGISERAITKILGEFKQRGFLKRKGRLLAVVDPQGLKSIEEAQM